MSIETDSNHYKKFCEDILKNRKLDKLKVIFFGLVGSHSFNLNVETSDCDYFGVFEADIDDILSGTNSNSCLDGHDPDFVLFEIEKFCELIYKGNPKLVEPIFVKKYCYRSEEWESLCEKRKEFISQSVIYHYISYSKSQLGDVRKLDTSNNDQLSSNKSQFKKLYHTMRLLEETKRMLAGEEPLVFLTGESREKIMDIRMGKVDFQETLKEIDSLFKETQDGLDKLKITNRLPPVCNLDTLNQWLVSIRRDSILKSKIESLFTSTDLDLTIPVENSDLINNTIGKFKELMDKNSIKGRLLFISQSGSRVHGTFVDGKSEEDWVAVYVSDTSTYVSLFPDPTRVDSETQRDSKAKFDIQDTAQLQRDTFVKGYQLFEVSYFLHLLATGNHRAVELIHSPPSSLIQITSNAWKELFKVPVNYLQSNLLHHYWGVSQGQLAKSVSQLSINPSVSQRHLYHALRMVNRSRELTNGNTPSITQTLSGQEREDLLSLKLETTSKEDILKLQSTCDSSIKEISSKIKQTKSKDKKLCESNIKEVHREWLIKLRKSMLT